MKKCSKGNSESYKTLGVTAGRASDSLCGKQVSVHLTAWKRLFVQGARIQTRPSPSGQHRIPGAPTITPHPFPEHGGIMSEISLLLFPSNMQFCSYFNSNDQCTKKYWISAAAVGKRHHQNQDSWISIHSTQRQRAQTGHTMEYSKKKQRTMFHSVDTRGV